MATLTLSEKSSLAATSSFRDRILQALFSKANVYKAQVPLNLAWQKQVNYSVSFLRGGAGGIDINVITRYWLANYNTTNPILDSLNQPIDSEILDSNGLDLVYNTLANVITGDDLLPLI